MDIRQFFFKFRGFTPVPLVFIVILFAQPDFQSFFRGILLMISGEFIRLWGVSYAGGATRTRNVGAHHLVTNGPFARVRNPLYIGNILMYCGAAVIANVWLPWLILIVLIYFLVQYHFIVSLEEEKLLSLFGEAYEKYKRKVPRFIPKIIPAKSESPVVPNYKGAVISEKSTFMSFAAIILLFGIKMYFFT